MLIKGKKLKSFYKTKPTRNIVGLVFNSD